MVTPGGSSRLKVFAHAATVARMVLLTPSPGIGSRTDVERTFTMRPYPAERMAGRHNWTSKWLARRWRPYGFRKSSSLASKRGPDGGPPVLLMRMWTGWDLTCAVTV